MATRPKPKDVIDAEIVQPPSAPTPAPMPEPPSATDSIEAIISGLPSTSSMTVYRADPNQPLEQLFQCHPSTFDLASLAKEHGGGRYRLYFVVDGKPYTNRTVVVPKTKVDGASGESGAVLDVIREGFRHQSEAMLKLAESLRHPPPQAMTMAEMMAGVSGMIASLRDVMRPDHAVPVAPSAPDSIGEKAVELIMKGVTLAQSFRNGEGGEERGLVGVLGDLMKSPMVEAAFKAAVARPVVRAAPTAPTAHAASTVPAVIEVKSLPPEAQMLKYALGRVLAWAESGLAPELAADAVLDQVSPALLKDLLATPDPVAFLAQLEPKVSEHSQWFSDVLAHLKAIVAEESEPEVSTHSEPTTGEPPVVG